MISSKNYFRNLALHDLGLEVDDYIIQIHNYLTNYLDKVEYVKRNDEEYLIISQITYKNLFIF